MIHIINNCWVLSPGWHKFFKFLLVPQCCWLDDRNDTHPFFTKPPMLIMFSFSTSGGRKLLRNQLAQVCLRKTATKMATEKAVHVFVVCACVKVAASELTVVTVVLHAAAGRHADNV